MAGRGGALRFVGPRARRPVMFVAEAPGRLGAARTGLPLHGDATGRNFEWLLDQVGWTRADVWVTNAVLCWPEGKGGVNDRPSREEIDACGGFLRRQLEIVDPLVVAPLGLVALEALGRLAPVERGPMRALAGKARSGRGAYSCRSFTPAHVLRTRVARSNYRSTTCWRFERSSITTSSSVWTVRSRTESSPRSRLWQTVPATMSAFWTWELHKWLHTWRTLEIVQMKSKTKAPICGDFAEPSDGLERSTPSLPCDPNRNRRQPVATVRRSFKPFFCDSAGRTFATGCTPSVP
jgi:uracil-DNA glycosylase family 4